MTHTLTLKAVPRAAADYVWQLKILAKGKRSQTRRKSKKKPHIDFTTKLESKKTYNNAIVCHSVKGRESG